MEKSLNPENSGSFSRNGKQKHDDVSETLDPDPEERFKKPNAEEEYSGPDLSNAQVLEEVDRFIETLSSADDTASNTTEIPKCMESLLKTVESRILGYDHRDASTKFGQDQEEDTSFFEAMARISMLVFNLGEHRSQRDSKTSCLNRASSVLHQAVSVLDDQFRALLDNSTRSCNIADPKTPKASKQSSFNSKKDDRSVSSQQETATEEEFPAFSSDVVSNMNRIANAMIFAGYEAECCLVYSALRRKAFKCELEKLGFQNISMDEVQRMNWETLEGEIAAWIQVMKHCSTNLFPRERSLCNSIFSDHHSIAKRLFIDLETAVTGRLLNFADAVVMTKRSTEKLFKFLDLYETLRDLNFGVGDFLMLETSIAKCRVGETAVSLFCELENSIKRDNGRIPVPSGAVHPLTRYTMNYLKYACEYMETLEQVFQQHQKTEEPDGTKDLQSAETRNKASDSNNTHDEKPKTSPFSVQLKTLMDLLDANLDMKSKLYRDPALRYIFLMNNGRYILQKIKGSTEIHEMMGPACSRKRSSELRQYHKNYQRETWSKVLQCISHEGLIVNGKVLKPVLKHRFKSFNTLFDDIHKTQSTWVVSDEQLQSELRVSISSVVIPAYRSFLGRFKQHLDPGRQMEKYIKYQPEDIETLIEELFDGNATSMARKRT